MVIAGTSELLLLASLCFAGLKSPKINSHLQFIYIGAITTTFLAAIMGFFRYLDLADTTTLHTAFSFASKHMGIPLFIGIALLSVTPAQSNKLPILELLGLSFISLIINSFVPLAILSDAVIILLLIYGIYIQEKRPQIAIQLALATIILLSTLLWGAIIQNPDIRIGIFHLCLSLFIVLFTSSINKISDNKFIAEYELKNNDTECT